MAASSVPGTRDGSHPRALLCLGLCLPTLALATRARSSNPPPHAWKASWSARPTLARPTSKASRTATRRAPASTWYWPSPPVKGNDYETDMGAEQDVRLVQLVLDEAGYRKLEPHLGQQVTLAGHLFSAETAFHYAPLLMQDAEGGRPADRQRRLRGPGRQGRRRPRLPSALVGHGAGRGPAALPQRAGQGLRHPRAVHHPR